MLDSLRFTNRFTHELPGDPETHAGRRQVRGACWSQARPTPVVAPRLVAHAREVAELLDIDLSPDDEHSFAEVFAGNRLLPGMEPFAMCYGGHQFGHWAGQLGDGRAINLGEVVNGRGEHWTLQLKGAGPTPYSRTADGLAVLRSSIREFLCSEAMHHLGVPTTRALSLVATGESVIRDMFYDGHPRPEPGAVVCRVAPSFTRFGNFQIFAARQEIEPLHRLVDFTLRTDFPQFWAGPGPAPPEAVAAFFAEVCRRTAMLMVHWMRVGFVHGVINTDNMSILGLTIDYGPYGWLENVDPDWTPNTTDAEGRRYRFIAQPQIAHWNLLQLANAFVPMVGDPAPFEAALDAYATHFQEGYRRMMADKLGIASRPTADDPLVADLWPVLAGAEIDMTLFFRGLATIGGTAEADQDHATLPAAVAAACYDPPSAAPDRAPLAAWLARYQDRIRAEGLPDAIRRDQMNAVNPLYVPRNYLAQLAIDAAEAGNFSLVREMLDVLRRPYVEQPGRDRYAAKRPDWARHRAGCSMRSCSS
ncbi:MAG: protein adenylyltransferase SelO [Planctomycetia bacterium]